MLRKEVVLPRGLVGPRFKFERQSRNPGEAHTHRVKGKEQRVFSIAGWTGSRLPGTPAQPCWS